MTQGNKVGISGFSLLLFSLIQATELTLFFFHLKAYLGNIFKINLWGQFDFLSFALYSHSSQDKFSSLTYWCLFVKLVIESKSERTFPYIVFLTVIK